MHMFFGGIFFFLVIYLGYYISILNFDIRYNSKSLTARLYLLMVVILKFIKINKFYNLDPREVMSSHF